MVLRDRWPTWRRRRRAWPACREEGRGCHDEQREPECWGWCWPSCWRGPAWRHQCRPRGRACRRNRRRRLGGLCGQGARSGRGLPEPVGRACARLRSRPGRASGSARGHAAPIVGHVTARPRGGTLVSRLAPSLTPSERTSRDAATSRSTRSPRGRPGCPRRSAPCRRRPRPRASLRTWRADRDRPQDAGSQSRT